MRTTWLIWTAVFATVAAIDCLTVARPIAVACLAVNAVAFGLWLGDRP